MQPAVHHDVRAQPVRATAFQIALYLAVVLPPVLVGLFSSAWWSVLARPWIFVAVGLLTLYALAVAMVAVLIFIGPGLGGYFLEAPRPNDSPAASFPTIETIAVLMFVGLGAAMLRGLRQWLLRP